jgi:gas vesicle protein
MRIRNIQAIIAPITRRFMMSDSEIRKNAMVGGIMLIAGGLLGAAAALLLAPQSGKQTRRDIARYSRKVRRQAEDMVDDFAGNVHGMVETIGERAEDILEKGKDMAHEAKVELLKVIDDGQAKLEKQKQRLSRIIG